MKREKQDNSSFEIQDTILRVQRKIPFDFKEMDIESRGDLYEKFKYEIPVVFINNQRVFTYRVSGKELKKMLIKLHES